MEHFGNRQTDADAGHKTCGSITFFTHQKITDSTTMISDISGVHSFLIEGSKQAAVIDSCTGAGNLKAYVETLTDKPVIMILTHGHCDHAGGAAGFDNVYLSESDWELVERHASMDMKTDYVRFVCPDIFEQLAETDFRPVRTAGYLPLKDGQVFELGGVTLEAIAVPGHTHGMTCILNIQERTILFGDACNNALFIWDEEATSIEEYLESLEHLKQHENRYDIVYLSHGPLTADKKILDGVMEACGDVLAGKADDQPFQFMEHELKLAKKVDEQNRRVDGKLGNLVYNPEKVFRRKT